mmetsp:Transcript_31853/g.66954  ORF Transcript_31853/g.66954 Transcript_31853/m.66954 type:complete len:261 (-) Transcript_31853:241-1023(-)
MPSRKRDKGKARRAKANATTANDDGRQQQLYQQPARQDDEQQFCRLINTMSLEEEKRCDHGYPPVPDDDICGRWMVSFKHALTTLIDGDDFGSRAHDPTSSFTEIIVQIEEGGESLSDAYLIAENLKRTTMYLASLGTDYFLQRPFWHLEMAGIVATGILVIENFDEFVSNGHTFISMLQDLVGGGERALTRYFSKRINCSCLKERYAQLRDQPKVSLCSQCFQETLIKKLMMCTRCRGVHYCSEECQTAHWPEHKRFCK